MKTELATFGAGCFWGPEETFRQISGVVETSVGYMGGNVPIPTYEQVCTGNTGHVEVVQISYDPEQISYSELLDVFWSIHNPTQVNRQGPDIGSQYRSVIFYHNDMQKELAEESKDRLSKSGKYASPIATEIVPASDFWRAEEYHQKYIQKTGRHVC